LHWYKISARIGGSVAGNKRRLSLHEYVKWAEFFDWERDQREKLENYLARIICMIGGEEIGNCFCPPLSDKERQMSDAEPEAENMLDPETGWAVLGSVFGKKE
jgi:hypothetical protein